MRERHSCWCVREKAFVIGPAVCDGLGHCFEIPYIASRLGTKLPAGYSTHVCTATQPVQVRETTSGPSHPPTRIDATQARQSGGLELSSIARRRDLQPGAY